MISHGSIRVYTRGAFKKGHISVIHYIQILLDIGKENVYVLELKPGSVDENEAAELIARAAAGAGLSLTIHPRGASI